MDESKIKIKQIGCLLIHGFGGNVDEVRPLAECLKIKGYKVESPLLTGHSGKRRDLKKCNYEDWIACAKECYDRLHAECDTIYLVGFSMGGLISFQLSVKCKVDAIVTLNAPIYFWDFKRVGLNILQDFKDRKPDNFRRYIKSSIGLPFGALINFRILLAKTKPILNQIVCPVFIVQGLEDDTVRQKSANYIFYHIASQHKKLRFYKNADHVILWSKASKVVIRDVVDFLEDNVISNINL